MKLTKILPWTTLTLAFVLAGCKSGHESAADKYLKGGDPINAIVQYEKALAKGKVSKTFYKNYAMANVQLLDYRGREDAANPILDVLSDTITSILTSHPNPETEATYAQTLSKIASERVKMGADEGAFLMLQKADRLSSKPTVNSDAIKQQVVVSKLKEIEDDYQEAATEPTAGILADYKMNKLALLFDGKEIPEIRGLWSKIRQVNLSTYLMYDLEGLITDGLDSRINKYGVLLAILKLEKGSTSTKIQAKVFNGGSGAINVLADQFTLVDREGNAYKPSGKLAAFTRKDPVNSRDESKTGGLTFTHPTGAEPWYLEFKSTEGAGTSRKYLP